MAGDNPPSAGVAGAAQVDPEAQQLSPIAAAVLVELLEKAAPVVMQLSLAGVKALGPTAPKPGHEPAFVLYNLAILTTYGLNIALGICLIVCLHEVEISWVRRAARPLIFVTLAVSFATAVLGTFLNLLP